MAPHDHPVGISRPTSSLRSEREAAIERIAAAQHDQITFGQLREAGLSATAISNRAARRRLHRVYPGVYSVGRPPKTPLQHRMAAVLACGDGAGLSFAAAGAHHGLRESAARVIDVTSPTGRGRGLDGIRAHRSRTLAAQDLVTVDGIPTTSVARTLLDLASVLNAEALSKAFDRAETLRVLDLRAITDVMRRNRGHHGLPSLKALLSSLHPQTKHARNGLERLLLSLLDQRGLPAPEVNADLWLSGRHIQPDFLWRAERLVVETDGWETHGTRLAFERDRGRDQLLTRHGYRVIRITWRQLRDEPNTALDTIAAGLALGGLAVAADLT